jgi:hypothetical protein
MAGAGPGADVMMRLKVEAPGEWRVIRSVRFACEKDRLAAPAYLKAEMEAWQRGFYAGRNLKIVVEAA